MGWRDTARDRVKAKQEGKTIKLLEGDNCLRVLPNKKDLLPDGRLSPKGIQHSPVVEFCIHRDVGPDKAMVGCGRDIDGAGECWLCDTKLPELLGANSRSKALRADEMRRQEQFLVQASRYDRDAQKFGPPKPWWVSTGGRDSLAVRVYSRLASSRKDFVDPVKGYNINVRRSGTGLGTRYPEVEGDDETTKVPAAVLATVKPLAEFVPQYDEDDQKSAYYGRPRKGDETEEEEERNGRETVEDTEDVVEEETESDAEVEDTDTVEEEPEPEETEELEEIEEEPPPPPKRAPAKATPKTPSTKRSARPQPEPEEEELEEEPEVRRPAKAAPKGKPSRR